jgi:hypothetical protein
MTPGSSPTEARAPGRRKGWPRALRRGPMEALATAIIAAGVIMLMQPFTIVLYTHSFVVTLAGVVMFMIVSKFPE